MRDYFDDKTITSEALQNSARVYLIYPYLHNKRRLEPFDLEGLTNITRNILNAIEALRTSEVGHGHISESHMLIEPVRRRFLEGTELRYKIWGVVTIY